MIFMSNLRFAHNNGMVRTKSELPFCFLFFFFFTVGRAPCSQGVLDPLCACMHACVSRLMMRLKMIDWKEPKMVRLLCRCDKAASMDLDDGAGRSGARMMSGSPCCACSSRYGTFSL